MVEAIKDAIYGVQRQKFDAENDIFIAQTVVQILNYKVFGFCRKN